MTLIACKANIGANWDVGNRCWRGWDWVDVRSMLRWRQRNQTLQRNRLDRQKIMAVIFCNRLLIDLASADPTEISKLCYQPEALNGEGAALIAPPFPPWEE